MKKEIEVTTPSVPNFIKVGNEMIPLYDFTDEELQEIGIEWTKKLIERARQQIKVGL